MPVAAFNLTTIVMAAAFLLSACQVETVGEAPAPRSEPMIAATPVSKAASNSRDVLLSGPVASNRWTWYTSKGHIDLFGMVREVNGMTVFCGVKAVSGRNPHDLNTSVLSAYKFFAGDTLISKGTAHFATAKSAEDAKTTPVNCKSTNKPWKPAYAKGPWSLRHSGTTSF